MSSPRKFTGSRQLSGSYDGRWAMAQRRKTLRRRSSRSGAMFTAAAADEGSAGHWPELVSAEDRDSLPRTIELIGARRRFKRNSEVYGAREPADYFYKVVSGMVRAYKVTVDGRRHVSAFYVPADVFGLETSEQHVFSAEAVTDAEILVVTRSTVTSLAAQDGAMA